MFFSSSYKSKDKRKQRKADFNSYGRRSCMKCGAKISGNFKYCFACNREKFGKK